MGVEIERKFLIDKEKWQQLAKPGGVYFKQGYIVSDAQQTIRIRIAGDNAFLTIKGATTGISRKEYEYTIPVKDAQEMLDSFAGSIVEKTRCYITFAGKVWEADEFLGDNQGLLVAEIELEHEAEEFEIPEWVMEEVTGDGRYYNSNLSIHPFTKWKAVH
jgi:adenylate cyclase